MFNVRSFFSIEQNENVWAEALAAVSEMWNDRGFGWGTRNGSSYSFLSAFDSSSPDKYNPARAHTAEWFHPHHHQKRKKKSYVRNENDLSRNIAEWIHPPNSNVVVACSSGEHGARRISSCIIIFLYAIRAKNVHSILVWGVWCLGRG